VGSWRGARCGTFVLAGWSAAGRADGGILTVYIEGDGLAYVKPGRSPRIRRPATRWTLPLAVADGGAACSISPALPYVGGVRCPKLQKFYWSNGRFAPEVVAATIARSTRRRRRAAAASLELVRFPAAARSPCW